MHDIISVEPVSDGVLVTFEEGLSCYFSASFLWQQIGTGTNQIFLDYDPSPGRPGQKFAMARAKPELDTLHLVPQKPC